MNLMPHQPEAVSFLARQKRAILADDMGLGKTVEAITATKVLQARKILVICPNSLKLNWKRELEMWYPTAPVTVVDGPAKQKIAALDSYRNGFLIVNFESARGQQVLKYVANPRNRWDVLIVDEAHRIKNRRAMQSRAVFQIGLNADAVFSLTGTPIMNHGEDLWSLLHLTQPDKYRSFWEFMKEHYRARERQFGWGWDDKPINPPKLAKEIQPYFLRREKSQVLDLPDKTFQDMFVQMEGRQRELYDEMEEHMITEVKGEPLVAPVIVAKILRLKQICVSPFLIGDDETESAKINALMEIVEGTEGKIVVFSQFSTAVALISMELERRKIGHVTLTGDVKIEDRNRNVNQFQNDRNTKLFLATIRAGGVGITLTAAQTAVFTDKDWTPAMNQQAVDRLHRIGQQGNVHVINLLAEDSIEEWIERKLDRKTDLVEQFNGFIEKRGERYAGKTRKSRS